MDAYQAVIVGAGQAGWPLARALAGAGWKVALVERRFLGGTCVNDGCTPTKTLIASARVAHLARRSGDYGVRTGEIGVDFARVRQRVREQVETSRSKIETEAAKIASLEVIHGSARFTAAKTLEVNLNDGGSRRLEAELVFLDTGTRNHVPDIEGLSDVPFLDHRSLLELETVPEHLLILGGGYVGLEFAQAFRRFGSRVTILERGERLLPKEDDDIAQALLEVFHTEEMNVHLGANVEAARRELNDVALEVNGETLRGSHLLVATGRQPNTDALDLEVAGIETDERGFIRVNEHLETSARDVYALGEVNGGPAHTHVAYDDGRIVRDAMLEQVKRSAKHRVIPYTMYTDPQLARVGMNENEARASGKNAVVYTLPMTRVARALETAETAGLMKAVVDDHGKILGAAVLGVEGGELLSLLQTAMMGGLTAEDLREAMYAHPSLSESVNNLFSGSPRAIREKSASPG
jgi:pyruvate/2-oxoglutarate dehydrogenase complex dihydrolipoamide dehydrogenase (E3) component